MRDPENFGLKGYLWKISINKNLIIAGQTAPRQTNNTQQTTTVVIQKEEIQEMDEEDNRHEVIISGL